MDFVEHAKRGLAFAQEGKTKEALKEFDEALKLQPGNADILRFIEMVKKQDEVLAEAAQSYAREAEQRATVLGIAVTDVDKAIAKYTQALKRNPNDASAKSDLACAYYIRGLTFTSTSKMDHDQAAKDYEKALEYEPDSAVVRNKLGTAYLEIGKAKHEIKYYDKAIAECEKVIKSRPDEAQAKQSLARAYMERGMAHDQKGDYKNVISDCKTVLKFDPGNNTARELLGMAEAELAKAKRN